MAETLQSYLEQQLVKFKTVEKGSREAFEITSDIEDALSPYGSHDDLKDEVSTGMMVDVFELSVETILSRIEAQREDANATSHDYCYKINNIMRVCPPDISQSPIFQKMIDYADHLAAESKNTLPSGDTIDSIGKHIDLLPLLLQNFASVSGKIIQGQHFKAAPVDLGDAFNSCVLISPKDSDATLVIGRECIPMSYIEEIKASLRALSIV